MIHEERFEDGSLLAWVELVDGRYQVHSSKGGEAPVSYHERLRYAKQICNAVATRIVMGRMR